METRSITCFGVIKDIIESLFADNSIIPNGEIYSEIATHSGDLHDYYHGRRIPGRALPCYENYLCQVAYLYTYAPLRANLVKYIFDKDPDLPRYLESVYKDNGRLKICVLGSGPGTEMIGLAKWLKKGTVPQCLSELPVLKFVLLDKVKQWEHCCKLVESQLQNYDCFMNISCFYSFDITNPVGSNYLAIKFHEVDLYIISYMLSELGDHSYDQPFRDAFIKVVEQAKNGSKFLFVDRDQPSVITKIKDLACDVGIILSDLQHPDIRPSPGSRYYPDGYNYQMEEQKTLFGDIFTEMNNRGKNPEVTTKAFWVVGRKS